LCFGDISSAATIPETDGDELRLTARGRAQRSRPTVTNAIEAALADLITADELHGCERSAAYDDQ